MQQDQRTDPHTRGLTSMRSCRLEGHNRQDLRVAAVDQRNTLLVRLPAEAEENEWAVRN